MTQLTATFMDMDEAAHKIVGRVMAGDDIVRHDTARTLVLDTFDELRRLGSVGSLDDFRAYILTVLYDKHSQAEIEAVETGAVTYLRSAQRLLDVV